MMIPFFTFFLIACSPAPTKEKKDTVTVAHTAYFSSVPSKDKEYYANAIQPLYQSLLLNRGFNGSILLAKNGEIVFEDYRGMINFSTKEPITASTPIHVASISKTFTATVILKLMEEGKISLEDPVQKYLPSFFLRWHAHIPFYYFFPPFLQTFWQLIARHSIYLKPVLY